MEASGGRRSGARSPRGAGLVRPACSLVRLLYTSNPFYILSADLVFVGLRMSFGPGGPAAYTSALATSLAGYTLLLATTACVLIRAGRLWDDLRSLLVLVVMMFLAIALSGDDTMAARPSQGALGYLAGFLFTFMVTEGVLFTIRLRLPGWYRLSYYLILGLVFLYPIALSPLLGDAEDPSLQWGLFGFAPLAGLAVATLVPAARRGRAYLEKNGSPWRWPLYPWTLFVVLVGGLSVRCSSLCVAFHYVEGSRTIFGPYFLVPIGLGVSLVWLELGIASGRRRVMIAASVLPLGLAVLAATGHPDEPVYRQFLGMFMATLGATPFYMALVAAIVFLVYAAARRVPMAFELMAVGLAALAVVDPLTVDLHGLVAPHATPMGLAGLVLAIAAWRRRDSQRAALACCCFVTCLTRPAHGSWPAIDSWPIGLHLSVAALVAMGALFDDVLGRLSRRAGALAMLGLGLDAATGHPRIWPAMPPELIAWYPLLMAATGWSTGRVVPDRLYPAGAAVNLAAWLAHSGAQTYGQFRKVVVGLDQIAWGMLFFLVAMAISLRKAGLWPRSVPKCLVRLLGGGSPPGWVKSASPAGQVRHEPIET
jgi:hypothetical protein